MFNYISIVLTIIMLSLITIAMTAFVVATALLSEAIKDWRNQDDKKRNISENKKS